MRHGPIMYTGGSSSGHNPGKSFPRLASYTIGLLNGPARRKRKREKLFNIPRRRAGPRDLPVGWISRIVAPSSEGTLTRPTRLGGQTDADAFHVLPPQGEEPGA